MDALFSAVGIDLPKTGTVFATRTVVVSLAIGIIVTLLASLWPAYRSTRVPPIAAVREGSVLPPLRFARYGAARRRCSSLRSACSGSSAARSGSASRVGFGWSRSGSACC